MDLQDFDSEQLYFQRDINPEIVGLVQQAANDYGEQSEALLLKAQQIDGNELLVLIGLYRLYYFQQRYQEGIKVALQVLRVASNTVALPYKWQELSADQITTATKQSFTIVRLYLFALKAMGYLHLRKGDLAIGRQMLEKVASVDDEDRIGASVLLGVLNDAHIH